MAKVMKIYIKHYPDDPKALIDECPWYLKEVFAGEQFEVDAEVVHKNGTDYYQMVSTRDNINVMQRLWQSLSSRTRMRVNGGHFRQLFIEQKYAVPTGTNNRDFAFLLSERSEQP